MDLQRSEEVPETVTCRSGRGLIGGQLSSGSVSRADSSSARIAAVTRPHCARGVVDDRYASVPNFEL